jgi:Sugar-transfer associated ATP-grasp
MGTYGAGLRRAVKRAEDAAANYLYHSEQNRLAGQLMESMTSRAGGRKSPALFRQCDEYAKSVLGSIKYSPWLKAYTVLSGTFKEGWIPDNYYGKVVAPRLGGDYGEISNCKSISRRLFQTDLLPDLAYSVNGLLYTPSMGRIRPDELRKYLFGVTDKVVYKLDNGLQGKSVFVYDIDTLPVESTSYGNGVFQSYIVQHPFFDAFDSRSVATIRITTVVDDEAIVSCRAAYLRLPRGTDTHVKSATAIKVAINIHDGELDERGYFPDWVPTAHHPDSGKPFAHQIVPNFLECVAVCASLHEKLMFPRVIGWDVIVDASGDTVVMEWNGGHNDIKFSEAVTGPCFKDLGWQNLWRAATQV